jgi:NitT/TauT family transport system substrate-binding protein
MGSSGATPVTTLRARPYPLKSIARMSDISGAQQLIVKQSVKSLEELYGTRIGVLRGTASDALFNSIVKSYGLDASKFTVLNMGPTEMLQAFVRGEVSAVALWEAHSTRARKLGGGKILVSGTQSFIPGKEGAKRIMGDHSTLFAHENYIRDNPAVIRAVLTALLRATEYMERNKQETIASLSKEFDIDPADMVDVMAANRFTMSIDSQMLAELNQLAEFLYGLKRISTLPRAAEWVDPAPLRALRPDLVNLK